MPMLRAVPLIISIARSTVCAFKSGILVSAISLTWAMVIEPIFVLFGSPDPFGNLAAFLINTAAGGVFVINVNDRSA